MTALYEVVPRGASSDAAGSVDPLKYQKEKGETQAAASSELMTVKVRYKQPDAHESALVSTVIRDQPLPLEETSAAYRFSAGVATFGMVLGDSKFKGNSNFDLAAQLAQGALGQDPGGHRAELLSLIKTAQKLSPKAQVASGAP